MVLVVLLSIGAVLLVWALVSHFLLSQRVARLSLNGKHAIITGGSSGIGKATAIALAREGASITILARRADILQEAKAEIEAARLSPDQKVLALQADISDAKQVKSAVQLSAAENNHHVDILVTSAGISNPRYFEDITDEQFEQCMKINYLGTVYSVRAVAPFMKAHNGNMWTSVAEARSARLIGGRIVMVSSMAGLSGVIGYSAYSPSKFAVRGLAECLHMEFAPHNIQVSVVNPPDVDTPMLQAENILKPEECRLISEGSGVFSAERLAADIVAGIKQWRFFIQTGFDGHLQAILCSGMAPVNGVRQIFVESLTIGIIRFVSLFYLWHFNSICRRVFRAKQRKTDQAKSL